eukprot:TRINITY_DN4512_c0_g1_i1.p1 TRINITY_DN4512_c0_g1~~TRINITY_DN4512_c0_g1_i1.p1  ORF type:complete len:291 (-),score=28.58 TRINITY_DN4512_c0_g1_i1:29-901(-)
MFDVNLFEMNQSPCHHSLAQKQRVVRDGEEINNDVKKEIENTNIADLFPFYWNSDIPCLSDGLPIHKELRKTINDFPKQSHKNSNYSYGAICGTIQAPKKFNLLRIFPVRNENLLQKQLIYKMRHLPQFEKKQYGPGVQDYLMKKPLRHPIESNLNECWLFHGTTPKFIQNIESDTDANIPPLKKFIGDSMLFHESFSLANQFVPCPDCGNGARIFEIDVQTTCICKGAKKVYRMLLCRVFLGNLSFHPMETKSRQTYHSTVNDVNNDREFRIFDFQQVYPEYIIEYERE